MMFRLCLNPTSNMRCQFGEPKSLGFDVAFGLNKSYTDA